MVQYLDGFNKHLSEEALWDLSLQIKPRHRRQKRLPTVRSDFNCSHVLGLNNMVYNVMLRMIVILLFASDDGTV